MALDRLLNAKDSAQFILLCDSLSLSALPLLKEFASRALKDDQAIVLLCTEVAPEIFTAGLSPQANITTIDAYTNQLGWEDVDAENVKHHRITNIHNIRHVAVMVEEALKEVTSTRRTIIIDSLSTFLLTSPRQTFQFLKKLSDLTTDTTRLVVLYHLDIVPPIKTSSTMMPNILISLTHLASAIITIQLPRNASRDREAQLLRLGFVVEEPFAYMTSDANRVEMGTIVDLEWKRKSGKILYETNAYRPAKSGIGLEVVSVSTLLGVEEQLEKVAIEEVMQPDPIVNSSFNLSLTEEQRRARGNVVLPYTKAQADTLPTMGAAVTAGGSIYYEPDAADDFDDEDPDEDLNI